MKNLGVLVASLFLFLSLTIIVPNASQSLAVPVSIPIKGQYTVTGDLQDVPSKVNPEQLFAIDIDLGNARFLTRSDLFVDSPKWNLAGDQIAFQNGTTVNIWNVPNGSATVLPVEALSKPESWSPDNSEILYSRYDISTTPATESLNVLNLSSMTSRTLFAYQMDQPLGNLPLPPLSHGIRQLMFYELRQASWNPIYPDWIVVQIDASTVASTSSYATEAMLVPVTFLYNLLTGEMLSLDNLFTERISGTPIIWSPDGQYLAFTTDSPNGGNTHLVSFKPDGQRWTLSIVKSAPSEYQVLVGWLGAGDLLLTGANDPNTRDKLWYIAQIFDGQWHYTDFFRLPQSTFFRVGDGDWHITASEAEKQQLSCLFDDTLPTRLAIGNGGQVTFTGGTPSRLRAEPGTYSAVVASLREGTAFQVVGGAWCVDGYRWWQLKVDDQTTGWAAEADPTAYFLEPGGE